MLEFFPQSTLNHFNFLIENPSWEKLPGAEYLKFRKIIFIYKGGDKDPTSLLEVIAKHFADLISNDITKCCSVRLMSNCSNTLIGMID